MKKYISILLFLLPCLAFISSCNEDEIVFDHELPQFELRSDLILLEVIMPQGTSPDEEIFIVGPFNGGIEAAALDLKWRLQKAEKNDIKWGIYLDPNDFLDRKSLMDGFYFVSKKQGVERTLKNEESVHKLDVKVGSRTNVTVSRWAAYFEQPEEPGESDHDGYAVFVLDKSEWDALTLYAWGDGLPELFGAWPGVLPTGTVEIKGLVFKYFDTGASNEGLTYNLIFNNNNGGVQFDGPQVTLDHDIYLEITADGYKEIDLDAIIEHDGYAIFIEDNSGWKETAMYAWGNDLPELLGAWPGVLPTGTIEIDGVVYKYYDTGKENIGLTYNIIMNNNNGGSQFDLAQVTLDRDYYFRISDKSGEQIDNY